jgi:hypothetical protein
MTRTIGIFIATIACVASPALGQDLIWSTNTGLILRGSVDGSGATVLIDLGGTSAESLAVDHTAGKLYWGVSGTGAIGRANLDGTDVESLLTVSSGDGLLSIEIDPATGLLYWGDGIDEKIRRVALDGTGEETIASSLGNPVDLEIDRVTRMLYWGESQHREVHRTDLDGDHVVELLVPNNGGAIALDRASGFLFYGDQTADRVVRSTLDGTSRTMILADRGNPSGLCVHDLSLYFAQNCCGGASGIYVTAFDGSAVSKVYDFDGYSQIRDMIVVPSLPCRGDVDEDGWVDVGDLLEVLANWGPCPK